MAVEAQYTKQFPVVCTPEMRDWIEGKAQRERVSMAVVVRNAVAEAQAREAAAQG